MRIYLEDDELTYRTREPNSDDEWDNGDHQTDHNFGDAFLCEGNRWEDYIEVSDGDFNIGDEVHLVVVVYSTGCTFGFDNGRCVEILSAHKDYNNAVLAEKIVEGAETHCNLPDGYKLTYLPWKGYFESLDYVSIVTRTLR